MEFKGIGYFNALRIIGDDNFNIEESVNNIFDEPENIFNEEIIDRLYANVWGKGSEYFNNRYITDDSIAKFKLGYSSKRNMVTIPVHSKNGVPLGFVGRSIEGKKFKNSRGLKRNLTMFNLHRTWTYDTVYVVESAMDAIRLDQLGYAAVASLGSSISKTQIDLLSKTFDGIIVIPDNDKAGDIMVEKLTDSIPWLQILNISKRSSDVFKLNDEELTRLILTTEME